MIIPNEEFLKYCSDHGISWVSQLQQRDEGTDYKTAVWLIKDNDGLFKILKEVVDYPGSYLNEGAIFSSLPPLPFIPMFYGITDINGAMYIRRSFLYGQVLSFYCNKSNLLDPEEALQVILDIAEKLKTLQENKLLFLDMRPDNVLLSTTGVCFHDMGLSRLIQSPDEKISPVIIGHPRYCAPENVIDKIASRESIVFQLGLLAHELLTGEHPFDAHSDQPPTTDWEESVSRYLKTIISNASSHCSDKLIKSMLEFDSKDRPTLDECIASLLPRTKPRIFFKRKGIPASKGKTILFPARMGIPHKGHTVKFIGGLLDLGFKVLISIQRSYTITDRDPIPKWLVMKMVAQSLIEAGYSTESFRFVLTPFFRTQQEMTEHFKNLPGMEDVVAVASSNPTILNMFPDHEIITQGGLLGTEGEPFETLSWGEILRTAVKRGDYDLFKDYAAVGVEKILSFDELRAMYGKPSIEFVPGEVRVQLQLPELPDNYIIQYYAVGKYLTPEETIINKEHSGNKERDDKLQILDPYSKNTRVLWDGEEKYFVYKKTEFEPINGNVIITYQLK